MKSAVGLCLVTLAVLTATGCGVQTRGARVEVENAEGSWTFSNVRQVRLERDGYEIVLGDIGISEDTGMPILYQFVLRVRNTSDRPLSLLPGDMILFGMVEGRPTDLSPLRTMQLQPGQEYTYIYDPGLRADIIAYPFIIGVRISPPGGQDTDQVKLILY